MERTTAKVSNILVAAHANTAIQKWVVGGLEAKHHHMWSDHTWAPQLSMNPALISCLQKKTHFFNRRGQAGFSADSWTPPAMVLDKAHAGNVLITG